MFINLYESLLNDNPVYKRICIHIGEAMLTALMKQVT
ncbi:hypothetical protein QE429_000877 [Bacillus sp. SORGH_AS 510]|nr:hypothetical protein [Bacillus sp. SORGH_AS_0510]